MLSEGFFISVPIAYGYFVGSIPTAYLVGRWIKGIDLRWYGSRNIGGSNAAAHVGKVYFVPVVAFDLLVKGGTPLLLARAMGMEEGLQAIAGIAAVLGHSWPLYTRFVGGRGVSAAGGTLLILSPIALLLSIAISGLGTVLFKNSGLWVGIAIFLLPLWALLFQESMEVLVFSFVLVALLSIKRLEANRIKGPQGVSWYRLAARRLINDRDVGIGEEWAERVPSSRSS